MAEEEKPPGRWSRFLLVFNVLASQLNTALVTAGSFVITPAVLHGLGDSHYGGWVLMNSFVGYIRLLDQASAGTIKYGAGAIARKDDADVKRVFDTTAAVFGVVALLGAAVTCLLAFVLPHAYATMLEGQTSTLLILGGAMALDLGCRTWAAALRTRSLFLVCDGIEIVTYSIFKLGLTLYYAPRLDYHILALLTCAETVTRNALVILASMYFCPWVRRLQPFHADKKMFRLIALIGAAIAVIQVSDVIRFQLDSAVIGAFLADPSMQISIFSVGARILSIGYFAISAIGGVIIPRFSGLSEQGDEVRVRSLLRRASLATGLLSAYVIVNVAVFGRQFLGLWLKKPWTYESGTILYIMAPAYFITLFGGPTAALLIGRGKLRRFAVMTLVEAGANFLLSVALVKPLGIVGVALGTAIPMLLVRGIVLPLVAHKELGISPFAWWGMHIRSVIIGVVYLACVIAFVWAPLPSYGRLLLYGLATSAIYGVLVVIAIPEARAFVLRKLGRNVDLG